MANENMIPKATERRMPLYYRYFKFECEKGTERVSSKDISVALQIDSATIRRDFSHFGELGRKGYGYNVRALVDFFVEQLTGTIERRVAVIGVGNLGRALLLYNFGNNLSSNVQLCAGFDIDPDIIGTTVGQYEVYDMKDFEKMVRKLNLDTAILAVPKQEALATKELLEKAGIKGIMNFSATHIKSEKGFIVHDVDLTMELQSLLFKMKLSRGEYE